MTATRAYPDSPDAIAGATWDELLPYFEALATRSLDLTTAEAWLHDWSTLEEILREAASRAHVVYTTDTTDPAKEEAERRWSGQIGPKLHEQHTRLARRLLDLGYTRDDLRTTLHSFRNQSALFRAENVPLQAELSDLSTQYSKITGAMTVPWEGGEKTVQQLQPYLLDPDRTVRARAFRGMAAPYIAARGELAALFDQMYALRQQLAKNAGFANYRDYAHQQKDRFDYTPDDCARFHAAVEATVVPAMERIYARRRDELGVETLRPWDTANDPAGRTALHPFDDVRVLIDRARTIFNRLDPALGGYFGTMADEHLLDLDNRVGKAPGGYCTRFPYRKRPFIFMNAVGVAGDVDTLLHESGHAFHCFETDTLPFLWQQRTGMEMAEVASMAMELLTAPYLSEADGGYYSEADARRARTEHLTGILASLAHIASVDAFQQWLYTDPAGADADARDDAWLRIRDRFERGMDWNGLRAERVARWYRQLHIFQVPFYYIEYGLAQVGALQVWRNSLADHAGALASYRRALALGGTQPLPKLYEAAGAKLAFDAATMAPLVALIEEQIAALTD